jgi:hypothetical protein
MLIADSIRELVQRFMKQNASDKDIAALKALANLVQKLEEKPSPQLCYVAGWRGACEYHQIGETAFTLAAFKAYDEWRKVMEFDMFDKVVSEGQTLGMYDIREYPDGPPGGGIPVSKEIMEGFGKLGDLKPGLAGISLVDPDTKAKMHVPGEFVAPAKGSGSPTANVVLQERVANLERDLVALKRDMGERIRDLAKGTAKKWSR